MIIAGKHDLNVTNEAGSNIHTVYNIINHPDWNYDSENYDADIAIVVLNKDVVFSDTIKPICVPEHTNDKKKMGTVIGWGKSEKSEDSHDLRPSKIVVPSVDSTECFTKFPQLAQIASNRTFCGGFDSQGKAPCSGDSGGGFYTLESLSWIIRGVVSSSMVDRDLGCDVNKYSIYTNVDQFLDWIKQVMEESMGPRTQIRYEKFNCKEM